MKDRPRILIVGSTVILAGIEASLDLDPGCEIAGHAPSLDPNELRALRPDVVIFELAAGTPDFGFSLAQELPGLLLIGIDPETNRALLWSGWEAEALTSRDLAQAIRDQGTPPRKNHMSGSMDAIEA